MGALAAALGQPADAARRAFEAMIPAFALGLGRVAAAPPPPLVEALLAGPAGRVAASIRDAAVRAQGEAALKAMFGDPDAIRLLTTQAAAASGLAPDAARSLLPGFAAIVIEGVGKAAIAEARDVTVSALRNHPLAPPEPPAPPPSPFGFDAFAAWMRAFDPAIPAQSPVDAGFEALSRVFETGRALQNAQADLVRDALRALARR